MPILGVDVAKTSFEIRSLELETVLEGGFENHRTGFEQLQQAITTVSEQPLHVCLEATGRYGQALAHFLHQHGHRVSIVNPAQIKAFRESLLWRNKTDRSDALLIARFCQMHHPPAWQPSDETHDTLQQLTRHLDTLKKMRQQERNRLQAGLTDAYVLDSIRQHIADLDGRIEQLESHIRKHIADHPTLRHQDALLRSIPGIGLKTAPILLAEIPDIHAFDRPAQLVAYAGLNPQQHRSGTSIHKKTRISKRGNVRLRTALFFPAIVAKNRAAFFQPLVQRLQLKGHCPMSIVCAIMRKLLHVVFGVLKSGQPFDPLHLLKSQQSSVFT